MGLMIITILSRPKHYAALLVLIGIIGLMFLCIAIPVMTLAGMRDGLVCGMDYASALCPMRLNEHMSIWQRLVLPTTSSMSLALMFTVILAGVFSRQESGSQATDNWLRFWRDQIKVASSWIDYLRQQLSQGILQPKTY